MKTVCTVLGVICLLCSVDIAWQIVVTMQSYIWYVIFTMLITGYLHRTIKEYVL